MVVIALLALVVSLIAIWEEFKEFEYEINILGIASLLYNWALVIFFMKYLFF